MVPVVAKKSGQFTQGRVYVVGNVKDQTEPKTIEGMDWLTYYQVTIDCGKRRITINTHKEET
ncbi:unnamed protein product [Prunus armeniaca]|uniref:Uncharacterized protein n=1 Tax=Prunus armeniaca TaxID=36596 RepID=A0A6J5Y6R5_PRUAR|nr:unnamed protein product [Prunus armeniaca]